MASPLHAPACRSLRPPMVTTGPPHDKARLRRLRSPNAHTQVTFTSPAFNRPNQGRAAALLRARGFRRNTPRRPIAETKHDNALALAGPSSGKWPAPNDVHNPLAAPRAPPLAGDDFANGRNLPTPCAAPPPPCPPPRSLITLAGPTPGPARTVVTSRRVGRRRPISDFVSPDRVSRPPAAKGPAHERGDQELACPRWTAGDSRPATEPGRSSRPRPRGGS